MRVINGRLLDLVNELDRLGTEPTLADLGQTLQRVKLSPKDVADFVQATPRHYNRASIVVRDAYELLVMTWLPGQASVPHDHSRSICAMHVVQGEAVEGCYRVSPDGYVNLQYETDLNCGEVLAGQDAGVHTIRNSSATGELLVTVHVYSPPLRDFRQFRARPETKVNHREIAARPGPTVAIIGGGFSGAMSAAQTLRRAKQAGENVHVMLIERRGAVGEGLAYSTPEAAHLLNVPAGRMSAWPDRPDDFLLWANGRCGDVRPSDFLPRQRYGEYVRETLLKTADDSEECAKLELLFDEVRRVARHPDGGWMVHFAREPSMRADVVILAVGHRPPSDPIGPRWIGPRTRFVSDPWRPFATNVVGPDDPVIVLGSGLTAVDAVLSLSQLPRKAPITLISRNGLVPQSHAAKPSPPVDMTAMVAELIQSKGGVRAKQLLREVHRKVKEVVASGGDWRTVVDGLRPHTAPLWREMSRAERQKFLTRIRHFWEVHRHRMALNVAEPFQKLLESGGVRLIAGRVESATAESEGVKLVVRKRGCGQTLNFEAGWVINCTGPLPSNSATSNPVIGSLLVSGHLRADELLLGLETTIDGRAIGADGNPIDDLLVVGTLRKSTDWESTAVPELRNQASAAAEAALKLLERDRTVSSAR